MRSLSLFFCPSLCLSPFSLYSLHSFLICMLPCREGHHFQDKENFLPLLTNPFLSESINSRQKPQPLYSDPRSPAYLNKLPRRQDFDDLDKDATERAREQSNTAAGSAGDSTWLSRKEVSVFDRLFDQRAKVRLNSAIPPSCLSQFAAVGIMG